MKTLPSESGPKSIENSKGRLPMRTKLSHLLAAAIIFAACSTASADQQSHRKAADNLLKVMGVENQLQTSIDQMLELQVKSNPQIAPFKDAMKKFFAKHMSYSGLKEDFITIYVDAFTEEELDDITAFYRTPTGRKMAEKMPELSSKGMQLGAKRVQDNQAELRQMIQDEATKPK